jgi:hypothetical protein
MVMVDVAWLVFLAVALQMLFGDAVTGGTCVARIKAEHRCLPVARRGFPGALLPCGRKGWLDAAEAQLRLLVRVR